MDSRELCFMPAAEMAAAIRAGRLSPVEVVDAALARIDRLNPKLGAYCTVTHEAARAAAREAEAAVMRGDALGILHGVPVSIKDLVVTRGVRTTWGSRLYEHFVPEEDAPVVERLKQAGAIVVGKTNTPEFGYKGTTDNLVFGLSRNPWSLGHTPGGSSGGGAAAVAAGLGPLAVGTDGGGSVRIPCSCCGIFGLKPTLGRVAAAGCAVEEGAPGFPDPADPFVVLFSGSMAARLADKLPEWRGRFDPGLVQVIEGGMRWTAVDFVTAGNVRRTLNDAFRRFFARHDLLLTPTLAEPPVLLGTFDSPPDNPLAGFMRAASFTPFTPPFNVTGQPAISLPLAQTADGLPIGVQLVAAYGREDVLFRVAAQLEAVDPWANRCPPISAGG